MCNVWDIGKDPVEFYDKQLDLVQKLWDNQNELSDFVKFPDNLILKNIKSKKVPITNRLLNWKNNINTNHKDVHLAISALSPYAKWEQGYDEKDVGNDFLNKYGFFELIGPTGHYETSEMAFYVNFFDINAYYPWHNHEAEELYFIVSGKAKFECEDQDVEILSSTKTRLHKSFQPHAITTIENQVLSFVIWKNKWPFNCYMLYGFWFYWRLHGISGR